jgi:hypothetical protein
LGYKTPDEVWRSAVWILWMTGVPDI